MEDKKEIVMLLKHLLQATRAGKEIEQMELSGNGEMIYISFRNKCVRNVNVACDSGIAMILDVANALG